MLYGLDIFSGIGGLTHSLNEWVRPLAYVEIDRYCQGVLRSRMLTGHLPTAPIWDDVRSLDGHMFHGVADILYGGFPCQDISVAGNGAGLAGERSGLFREIVRLAEEVEPAFLFLENVPAIRLRGLGDVGAELARIGYDCRWGTLSAHDVGAPHQRDRWFLLAHANRDRLRHGRQRRAGGEAKADSLPRHDGASRSVADAERSRLEGFSGAGEPQVSQPWDRCPPMAYTHRRGRKSKRVKELERIESERRREFDRRSTFRQLDHEPLRSDWWAVEPDVDRVAHGVPARVDRLRALGNGVVPQCAREAFKRLMGLT